MHNGNSNKWEYNQFVDTMPEKEYQQQQILICDLLYENCSGPMFYSHKNRIVQGRMISPLEWLNKTKWCVHQSVVLNKGSGANVDKRRFFPVHELMFVCLKTEKDRICNTSCFTDVWAVEQTNRKQIKHPAAMPLSAAEKCVSSTEAQIFLDPYMGAGTTLIAAKKNGRKAIGIEIDEKYCELAANRIQNIKKHFVHCVNCAFLCQNTLDCLAGICINKRAASMPQENGPKK